MKKISILYLLLFVVFMFGFISCSQEPANDVTDEETVTILVPAFDDLVALSGERGLTDMFNDDTYFACFSGGDPVLDAYRNLYLSYGVMTTTPITPSLKPVSNVTLSINGSLDSLKAKLKFDAYGFHVEVDSLDVNLQEKKLMIKYKVTEGDEVVGLVDYVYNWKEKAFSYRECVMLTLFGDGVPAPAYTFGALILEMHDVKLEVDLLGVPTGAYSTGDLTGGSLQKNAFVDFIQIPAHYIFNSQAYDCIEVKRDYLTISSKNGVIYSMAQPDGGIREAYLYKNLSADNPLKNALSTFYLNLSHSEIETIGWSNIDQLFNWTAIDPHSFGIDFLKDLASLIYLDEDIISEQGARDIKNIPTIRSGDHSYTERINYGDKFVAYDVNKGRRIGAATQLLSNSSLDSIMNNQKYEMANFHNFNPQAYNSYTDETPQSDILDGLIEDHLRNCGITNRNYIENFKLCLKYAKRYNYNINDHEYCINLPVTTEDPSLFKAKLDATDWLPAKKNVELLVETTKDGLLHGGIDSVLSGSYGYGPLGTGTYAISANSTGEAQNKTLTGLDYYVSRAEYEAHPENPDNDMVTLIVIPKDVISVAADVITSVKFPNLARVEVFNESTKNSLPEDIKEKTIIID